MAETNTTRLGLRRWSDSTTDGPSRAEMDGDNAALETLAAIAIQGTLGARPAAGVERRYYHATDATRHFYDTGAAWVELGLVLPPGVLLDYAGAGAPAGGAFLLCDGSAVSRTTQAALFAAIGTTYGAGDGSTTFNLPDFRGRRAMGVGTGPGLTARVLGANGGAETVVIGTGNLPAHNHGVNDPTHAHGISDPTHHHNMDGDAGNRYVVSVGGGAGNGVTGPFPGNGGALGVSFSDVDSALTGVSVNGAGTGITTANTGSGTAVNVIDPFVVVTKIIKT